MKQTCPWCEKVIDAEHIEIARYNLLQCPLCKERWQVREGKIFFVDSVPDVQWVHDGSKFIISKAKE